MGVLCSITYTRCSLQLPLCSDSTQCARTDPARPRSVSEHSRALLIFQTHAPGARMHLDGLERRHVSRRNLWRPAFRDSIQSVPRLRFGDHLPVLGPRPCGDPISHTRTPPWGRVCMQISSHRHVSGAACGRGQRACGGSSRRRPQLRAQSIQQQPSKVQR
ncbi:hypothetical protein BC834DRAFT_418747 [Gloeopeniophorella convolvens]|nr:hypothetical protein BC834DRAFT_418747 [Gloeopeniophorella convolvens]